jgi:predicted 2-oxoglutarate/Fe(II)-dependent dioxygenase YbiX
MKYSEDTQKTLGLHTDASLVTGSVKLNDDYEGATLIFPRQGVTNRDIPIGKMLLFPGQVTHGHYVDQLVSGTKFSATFWTSRYKDDYLNE